MSGLLDSDECATKKGYWGARLSLSAEVKLGIEAEDAIARVTMHSGERTGLTREQAVSSPRFVLGKQSPAPQECYLEKIPTARGPHCW